MNAVYRSIGISKQAFHDRVNNMIRKQEELAQLIPVLHQVREDHPYMSSRQMYSLIQPKTIGRDRFESFCFEKGFKVEIKRNFRKTTNSLGVTRFENHLKGRELTDINQAWVSDITYYEIADKFYYLTFIMDLYSRKIVGYSASANLFTENTTIPAMKQAITARGSNLEGLIIHSDGGGQYYSKQFLSLTKGMINSMAEDVFENPHAERINGTIKNQYLQGYKPQNFSELKTSLERAVHLYNEQKPHSSLKKKTPNQFERGLSTNKRILTKEKRTKKEKDIHRCILN